MQVVDVGIPGAPYQVCIARGLVNQVARFVGSPTAVALVADEAIAGTHGAAVQRSLEQGGLRVHAMTMRAAEERKTLATVQNLCGQMLEGGLDRSGVVVAVGGGIVGDTAGFAAAVFMRGVALVQVPTTLLAMVDASIGGKTGVNLPRAGASGRPMRGAEQDATAAHEQLSKNQIGAFWQPRAVVCDPDVLSTLSARELRCGLAECVKHALIAGSGQDGGMPAGGAKDAGGDRSLWDWLQERAAAIEERDPAVLQELVARSAAVKARIVADDEREAGARALLNLGHTFAHAFEALDHANLKHGEAVAIGLVAAAHLAVELGSGSAAGGDHAGASLAEISRLLKLLGLPVRLPRALPVQGLLDAMRHDKKTRGGALRMVVPYVPGDVRVVEGVEPAAVTAALRAVGAQ